MDFDDEEPRKHPVPVPFCEIIAKPTVPELSLISLDENNIKKGSNHQKTDLFTGTQFQTYNAWKWKYMNGVDRFSGDGDKTSFERCKSPEGCFLIKDKYSSSETEKRKNEILYGSMDEPRRPIMPKPLPEIPKYVYSTSNSFEDLTQINDSPKSSTTQNPLYNPKVKPLSKPETSDHMLETSRTDSNSSKNLYSIITEQNRQIEILQQQMDSILRLQDVKDKQINQLLKSQEIKEKKIEKLLESIQGKDEEIDKLFKSKSKLDAHISDLLQVQEEVKAKNTSLLRKLKSLKTRETSSVSTMTDNSPVTDACTNTSFILSSTSESHKIEHVMSDNDCLKSAKEGNYFPEKDRSLSLHSVDLPVIIHDQVPTPQSSIHLDIQDFHYSSESSDSETETVRNNLPSRQQISANQLGYTFYNNIITQVKDIIQNSGEKEGKLGTNGTMAMERNCMRGKRSSVQSFQSWEVLERENIPPSALINPGNNFAKRFPHDPTNLCLKESYSPSDISLKMNTLAMKYLKQEQISQYNLETQTPITRQPDVTIYNVTNLSFGSTRMDRYNILSSVKEQSQQGGKAIHASGIESSAQFSRRRRKALTENGISRGNGLNVNPLLEGTS